MNNGTIPISASLYSQLVREQTIFVQTSLVSLTLLSYASILHFPDELQYIWKPKFTLTTFLYLLSKYSTFLSLIIELVLSISPKALSNLRVCNYFSISDAILAICSYIGVQGLILLRTYSICQGYRPMTIALSITFLLPIILALYLLIITPLCLANVSVSSKINILTYTRNIVTSLSDILAFVGVIHQVWGIRKLKWSLGLQSNSTKNKDLATLLLQQGILRFSFILAITITTAILTILNQPTGIISTVCISFQFVFSTLIMCDFTIALRRRNSNRSRIPNQSALNLPTLSLHSRDSDDPAQTHQSTLARIHESLLAEMAERSDLLIIDNSHSGDIELDDFSGLESN